MTCLHGARSASRVIATDEPTFQAVQSLAQKLGKITAVAEDGSGSDGRLPGGTT